MLCQSWNLIKLIWVIRTKTSSDLDSIVSFHIFNHNLLEVLENMVLVNFSVSDSSSTA